MSANLLCSRGLKLIQYKGLAFKKREKSRRHLEHLKNVLNKLYIFAAFLPN